MDFEKIRKKYKPNKIKYLFIAESPPKPESDRFFYAEEVKRGDSLFLATMRALHKDISKSDAKDIREQKPELLKDFQKKGFYLMDASEESIAGQSDSKKRRALEDSLCKPPFFSASLKWSFPGLNA